VKGTYSALQGWGKDPQTGLLGFDHDEMQQAAIFSHPEEQDRKNLDVKMNVRT